VIKLKEDVLKNIKKYKKILKSHLEKKEEKFPVMLGLSQLILLVEENISLRKDEEFLENLEQLYQLINKIFLQLQKTPRPTCYIIDPLEKGKKAPTSLGAIGLTTFLNNIYLNQIKTLERILT